MIRALLAKADPKGYELVWVSTRQAAIEATSQQAPDVILVGYRLGDCAGIQLIREIAAAGWRAPVMLLTGAESQEADFEAIA